MRRSLSSGPSIQSTKPDKKNPLALMYTAKSSNTSKEEDRVGQGCNGDPGFPPPQQRGDPRPAPALLAPPFAGFPDSALLPPRAARDPRCMYNGGWEQRRAGPGALKPRLRGPEPRASRSFDARPLPLPRATQSEPECGAGPCVHSQFGRAPATLRV